MTAARTRLHLSLDALPHVCRHVERPKVSVVVEVVLMQTGKFAAEEEEHSLAAGCDGVCAARIRACWRSEESPFVLLGCIAEDVGVEVLGREGWVNTDDAVVTRNSRPCCPRKSIRLHERAVSTRRFDVFRELTSNHPQELSSWAWS